jgi:hypothetical protein
MGFKETLQSALSLLSPYGSVEKRKRDRDMSGAQGEAAGPPAAAGEASKRARASIATTSAPLAPAAKGGRRYPLRSAPLWRARPGRWLGSRQQGHGAAPAPTQAPTCRAAPSPQAPRSTS